MSATRTRPRIRDHLHVGLRVINTTDLTVWRITQIWRADREALLVAHDGGDRRSVAWSTLAREYACIQPFGAVR